MYPEKQCSEGGEIPKDCGECHLRMATACHCPHSNQKNSPRSLPMLSGLWKDTEGGFAKRFEKVKKYVGAMPTQTTTKLTGDNLHDWHQIVRSQDPTTALPSRVLALSCSAEPLGSCRSNGLMIYKHALYKKNKYKKAVPKHSNGFESATSRERTCAHLNRCAAVRKPLSFDVHFCVSFEFYFCFSTVLSSSCTSVQVINKEC